MKKRIRLSTLLALMLLITNICFAQGQPSAQGAPRSAPRDEKCPVTVAGAVRAPSRLQLRRPVRLLEALAIAGGITERAGKSIQITHAAADSDCSKVTDVLSKKSVGFEVYDLTDLLRRDEKANPLLQPGDVVMVIEAEPVYIVGSVVNPKALMLKEPLTLMQALALAGGLRSDARTDKVRVIRHGPGETERAEILVNLEEIKKDRSKDVLLRPFDIVDVPSKYKARPFGPPLIDPRPPKETPRELPLRVIV